MPDLRFRNGKFYFSILNNDNGFSPLLIPSISNPDFIDITSGKLNGLPGIVEILNGELGITERIMKPVLDPILSVIDLNPAFATAIAGFNSTAPIEETKQIMLKNLIPDTFGIKAIEKTIITSMMDSHKPLMDFLKILIEMLSVGEDAFCRYLGTSIKILGKEIGFPSRNPSYWADNLNYTETITHALGKFTQASDLGVNTMGSNMSDKHPIKNNVPNPDQTSSNPTGSDNREALYVGYFDEDGNNIEPPKWIKDSNKWVDIDGKNEDGVDIKVQSPFPQLSKNFGTGIEQLLVDHDKAIKRLNKDKDKMISEIQKRIDEIGKLGLTPELKEREIESLNTEKVMAKEEFDSLVRTINDVLYGTNKEGFNSKTENDNGVANDPAVVGEWVGKTRSAQLRSKYFPEQKATVQALVDRNGNAREPYTFIPKHKVSFRGRQVDVEVPLAYPNQIERRETGSTNIGGNSVFFDQVHKTDKNRRYSYRNEIRNIDILYNTDITRPYNESPSTYFSNNKDLEYVADNVKDYYNSLEWDEILEYEIRSKKTGNVLRTERELIQNKINIENDYDIRLIKVVNIPLIPPPSKANQLDVMPANNRIAVLREDSVQLIEYDETPDLDTIELLDSDTEELITYSNPALTDKEEEILSRIINPSFRDSERTRLLLEANEKSKKSTTLLKANKFKTSARYISGGNIDYGSYVYIRKNIEWGEESKTDIIDVDSISVFKVENVEEKWVKVSNKIDATIIIDNITKTISVPKSQNIHIPDYIFSSSGDNFEFFSGSNSSKKIKIIKQTINSNNIIYTYIGKLTNDSIGSIFNYGYLESKNTITLSSDFKSTKLSVKFDAYIYIIKKHSVVPEIFRKNKNQPIIIQGLDQDSVFSISRDNDQTKRNKINTTKFKKTTQLDNFYNVTGIRTEIVNGISVEVLVINTKFPKKYINKSYSGESSDKFSYPLRIVTLPNSDSIGSDSNDFINTNSGTLFTFNNNIPNKLTQEETGNSINNHSTPDINQENDLKEGIIFHGLDPRYIDPIKYKHFWLVEAIKKDNRDISAINGEFNPRDVENSENNSLLNSSNTNTSGKEWYGLLDKFTAVPIIITKLVPIITKKMIPLIVKIIQLVSNPNKIKEFLLDLGIRNEDFSNFPKIFKSFSENGSLGKISEINKGFKVPTTLDEQEQSTIPKSDDYYTGIQVDIENPSIISALDGQAAIEFGKGAFGKSIVDFGLNLNVSAETVLEPITKKTISPDINKAPKTKDQPIFTMILNMIKLPIETIFMIFKWLMSWVKKLLNPLKIPGAIIEFLSFKWLKDILGKDSIFKILGIPDPFFNPSMYNDLIDSLADTSNEQRLAKLKEVLSGEDPNLIEVLIYNVFINGQFVRKETEERPYGGDSNTSDNNKESDISLGLDLNNINTNDNISPTNGSESSGDLNVSGVDFCGERFFNIKDLIPIPFWTDMPSYNICELPQVFLKPLETVAGLLKMIQGLINGFLSMPTSILGLEPHISLPKFGEEIPFANIVEDIINKLRETLTIKSL